MNLTNVLAVASIPVASTIIPNLSEMRGHSHLCEVSLTEVKRSSVTSLIGNDHLAAHQSFLTCFRSKP